LPQTITAIPVPAAARPEAAASVRLLVCSAGVPHASEGASAVLFYHYIARLRREGYRIRHLLLLPGNTWSDADVAHYAAQMADPADSDRFTVDAVRADRFHREGRCGHQLVTAPAHEVAEAAEAAKPDLIVVFDILAAWLLRDVPAARRIVWLGDLNFQTVLLHARYAAQENPLHAIHLPSNWLGAQGWKRIYRNALRDADQVIASSGSSVTALARIGIESEYEPYPWPESPTESCSAPSQRLSSTPTFLFFGSLGGLGSRSAFHFMMHKIYPKLRRLWGERGFRILIAGRGTVPAWAVADFAGKPEIESFGFVPDLDGLLGTCHAMLAPIEAPVGNRSRILTALSRRCLVIAHANAARGNPDLRDGDTCYLAANADEFVTRMQRAVTDRAAADAIAARGYRMYVDRFGVVAAGDRFAARVRMLAA
jgi:glycosyltransferase involved in cell wall biosynthesis